jgi:uncharacterized protein YfiM (DUF2279 family)
MFICLGNMRLNKYFIQFFLLFIFSLLHFQFCIAQKLETSNEVKNKRVKLVTGISLAGYGGAMVGLYNAWYKKYPQTSFHTFNDNKEWLQVDKVGHMYSAYLEGMLSMELWKWSGVNRKKYIWLGGLSGATYQTVIEVLDGYSAGWGWSWGDFAANVGGSALLISQELAWDQQRVKLKFSTHPKNYLDPSLNSRSDNLFGKTFLERMIKDYNGQTYWASVNPTDFSKKDSKWPSWLSIAIGYGAEGLFGGTENIAHDQSGNITFNRTDIARKRQWYIAPDIDLTKIKTKKKGVKLVLAALSSLKFPAPALEFSKNKIKVHPLYF